MDFDCIPDHSLSVYFTIYTKQQHNNNVRQTDICQLESD